MDLLRRFVEHTAGRALLPAQGTVVVACSGGGDSTALARLVALAAAERAVEPPTLAHLDHGLQAASLQFREAAERLAAHLGCRIVAARRLVVAAPDESPEEAARRVRLDFLADVARRTGAGVVLTGHQMDDQAETVLQRVLRGTGVDGLGGIPERRRLTHGVDLVRPLLPFRRAELRDWLHAAGVAWCEDATNDDGNERARLRGRVFPLLAACTGRDPVPLLARLAANAADAVAGRDVSLGERFLDASASGVLVRAGFELLPVAVRVAALRAAVPGLRSHAALTRDETGRLLALLAGAEVDPVAGLGVERAAGGLQVVPLRATAERLGTQVLDRDGNVVLPDGRRVTVRVATAGNRPFLARLATQDGSLELVDADRLRGPLHVRGRAPGDRVQVLGAACPARLGHVLQRRGVAAAVRDRVPLLCDDEGIVWIAGVAPAERVRVRPETTRIALLTLFPPEV